MYIDTILFIICGICALLALLSVIYLVVSNKRSRVYRSILQQETEFYDALSTTVLTQGVALGSLSGGNLHGETTQRLDNDDTEFLNEEDPVITDFDATPLEGRYIIEREIHGGGMSRVFLAENVKLGNRWIIKFISNSTGELANEENILKLLNHTSLPKIIDIYRDDKGVYIVESFIEGASLDKILDAGQKINQAVVLDWAEQLAQALNYLHKMEPHPIYHFDLKPSNIMVTHDNRLVLIDFGVSKRFGKDTTAQVGITYQYAAPEQLKHRISEPEHMSLLESRFGELPADRLRWNPDARTDIYSLGVILFEIVTGVVPTTKNMNILNDLAAHELCEIIRKCMTVNPDKRYQSVNELLADLQKAKGSKVKMARAILVRRLAFVATVVAIVISGGSFSGGYYIYAQENAALLDVEPGIVTVSLQQSSELTVEKQMPSGKIAILDNSQIIWSFSRDNIARVDGNRISGLNVGTTEISGRYRNKTISLNVRVVEPMDGMVEISQRFELGHTIGIFAGTSEREHIDGKLSEAEFVSPESIDIADDGTIYIADSGLLRIIKDGNVESMNFEPNFLTPHIVRCYENGLYILTDSWEDEGGVYYGIIKLTEFGAESLYMADARYTAIEDFCIGTDGLIYYIDRNEGLGIVCLKTLNLADVEDVVTVCELSKGTSSLTIDDKGAVYLANPETGVIQVWRKGELSYFAGIENEKAFIDGAAPLFYMPQKIRFADGFLYVWDFNVLRRIAVIDGAAAETITIAGEASPVFDMDVFETRFAAEDIVLPNSRLMDFTVSNNAVLLTDPKRGVMWRTEY